MLDQSSILDRSALAAVFTNPRTLLAFEAFQRAVAQDIPSAVNDAQSTADGAAAAIDGAAFVVTALSGALTNERVLSGGTGVTVDISTADVVRIVVNVLTILGYTPANKAGETFTGAISAPSVSSAGGVAASGAVSGASGSFGTLSVGSGATTSTATVTHTAPVTFGGTTYHVLLSTSP